MPPPGKWRGLGGGSLGSFILKQEAYYLESGTPKNKQVWGIKGITDVKVRFFIKQIQALYKHKYEIFI